MLGAHRGGGGATLPAPAPLTARSRRPRASSAPSTSVQAAQLMTTSGRVARSTLLRDRARSTMSIELDVRSRSRRGRRRRRRASTSRPSIPSAPVTSSFTVRHPISELSPTRKRRRAAGRRERASFTLRPSRLASMRVPRSRDARAGEDDRVLDLGAARCAAVADRGVGADVGVARCGRRRRSSAGPRTMERSRRAPASIDDPPLHPRLASISPSMRALDLLQHQPVGLEHVVELAGVLPPALHHLRLHPAAARRSGPGSPR